MFRKGFYLGNMLEFVTGRVHWDNWLLWFAGRQGAALVDASAAVVAVHQNHDYGYHPEGKTEVWNDGLAQRNLELAGGDTHLGSMSNPNYLLTPTGIKKRTIMERWSNSARVKCNRVWHPLLDRTRTIRHMLGSKRKA